MRRGFHLQLLFINLAGLASPRCVTACHRRYNTSLAHDKTSSTTAATPDPNPTAAAPAHFTPYSAAHTKPRPHPATPSLPHSSNRACQSMADHDTLVERLPAMKHDSDVMDDG